MRLVTFITIICALPLPAQKPSAVSADVFDVEGHKAVLYAAPKAAEGKPWVWYAPTLKGGVSLAGRLMYFEAFMHAGISLAGFDLGEVGGRRQVRPSSPGFTTPW